MDWDSLIAQSAAKIHAHYCNREVLHGADDSVYWNAIVENGLHLAWASEEAGGFGADLPEIAGAIWNMTPSPLPFVETLIANKLLESAGLELCDNRASFAIASENNPIPQKPIYVPLGMAAEDVIIFDDGHVSHYKAADGIANITNHLSPDDDAIFDFSAAKPMQKAASSLDFYMIETIILALRTVQMAAAMDGALSLSIDYISSREQFGRPLSKFQAIQHQMAIAASEVAAAAMAASQSIAALETMTDDPQNAWMQAVISKVQLGHSAETITSAFHQVHGAMGYTMEYDLHHYTRRIWAWRDGRGNEHLWAQKLGAKLSEKNSDQLWQGVTMGQWQ